ncbi:spermidine synthase [Methylobacterium sp.]|nr:spermidine synthase [Methylobacterium sp.]
MDLCQCPPSASSRHRAGGAIRIDAGDGFARAGRSSVRRRGPRHRSRTLIPWVHLDTAAIPGEPDPMRLMRRGDEFSIVVGTIELMNNRLRGSEQALGTLTCQRLRDRARPRILIGGLGMGFTLRAALDALPPSAQVTVAELMPAVVDWARGPLAPLFAGSLDDPRVEVRVEDVNRTIQSGPEAFDAILLDVDNGPEGLTRRSNDRLYDVWGLGRARYALRPGGILAVWSGSPDRRFKSRLQRCGFAVDEQRVHANGRSGRRHVLWLATRPSGRD